MTGSIDEAANQQGARAQVLVSHLGRPSPKPTAGTGTVPTGSGNGDGNGSVSRARVDQLQQTDVTPETQVPSQR